MSYNAKIDWKDHVVERPRTYRKTTNTDGSETYTPAPGEIIQQGTPQSATNFNQMEEAIQHLSIAFDMLLTIHQAELRGAQAEIETLKAQVAALGGDS